MQTAATK